MSERCLYDFFKAASLHPPAIVDEEQLFIEDFVSKSVSPLVRGREMKGRKIVVFGQGYKNCHVTPLPLTQLPPAFRKWCSRHHCTGNSITVDICEKSSKINWHLESARDFARSEVVCVSFASNANDRGKFLAEVFFRWPDKKENGKKKTGKAHLKHQTILRFNARKHERKLCENRKKSLESHIRVTFRTIRVS